MRVRWEQFLCRRGGRGEVWHAEKIPSAQLMVRPSSYTQGGATPQLYPDPLSSLIALHEMTQAWLGQGGWLASPVQPAAFLAPFHRTKHHP